MSYAINNVVLQGRIPDSEKIINAFRYYPGSDTKQSMIMGKLSVNRYKKKDAEYPRNILVDFRAFGTQADYMNKNFKPGDYVIISGEYDMTEKTETEEGKTLYPSAFVLVRDMTYQRGNEFHTDVNHAERTQTGTKLSFTAPKAPSIKRPEVGSLSLGKKLKAPF